jgi:hypothetical protein
MSKKKISLVPNLGILFENTGASKLRSEKIAQTGGNLFTGAAGLEFGLKKFTAGANIQLPLGQDFASGQTTLKMKAMVHLTVAL